jgi:hypothetical protein
MDLEEPEFAGGSLRGPFPVGLRLAGDDLLDGLILREAVVGPGLAEDSLESSAPARGRFGRRTRTGVGLRLRDRGPFLEGSLRGRDP